MRDDIKSIVAETKLAVERKIALFNRFLAREHELNTFLKTDFDNEPLLIMESEDDIIGEINIQDYIIAGLNDEFRKKTGKNLSTADLSQYPDDDGTLTELEKFRKDEKALVAKISTLRKANNELMESIKKEILSDAGELKRMRELNINYTKDSRSSF